MSIKFTGLTPTLQVSDLDQAIAFYGKLGFEAQWIWPDGKPTHASLKKDAVSFMIALQDNAKDIQRGDLYFWVEDIESYSRLLKEAGLNVPDLADTEYGMRDTSITDPWGHHLTFGEPLGSG